MKFIKTHNRKVGLIKGSDNNPPPSADCCTIKYEWVDFGSRNMFWAEKGSGNNPPPAQIFALSNMNRSMLGRVICFGPKRGRVINTPPGA